MKGIRWLNIKTNTLYAMSILFLFAASCFPLIGQQNNLAAMRAKAREAAATRTKTNRPVAIQTKGKKGNKAARLQQAQNKQAQRYGVSTIPLASVKIDTKPDLYSQSQAHLHLGKARKLIAETYDTIPYLNIISECLTKETSLKDTHYVFYQAYDNEWRILQDLDKALYNATHPNAKMPEDFVPLRSVGPATTDAYKPIKAHDFLVKQLKTWGMVNDTLPEVKSMLLSTNLAMFGNVGLKDECTWHYFMQPSSRTIPGEVVFTGILNNYNVPHSYIKEVQALVGLLQDAKDQTLLQIFVPAAIVDDVAYISFFRGIPAYSKMMDWVYSHAQGKKMRVADALRELTKTFEEQQEKNPLFKGLMKELELGKFSAREVLHTYRNRPWDIKTAHHLQARLLLTNDGILNYKSGTKFYRYSTIEPKTLAEYHTKLNSLAQRMVNDATQAKKTAVKPKTPAK